jgi:hypothetical protein
MKTILHASDWYFVERRSVVSPVLPGESIWEALYRMHEYVDYLAWRKGNVADNLVAHHEGGKEIKVTYSLYIHEDLLFPEAPEAIH